MLYGAESWAANRREETKVHVWARCACLGHVELQKMNYLKKEYVRTNLMTEIKR